MLPLATQVLTDAGQTLADVDVVAYTRARAWRCPAGGRGRGLRAGRGAGKPVLGVHHLEGHLLSPF